MPLNSTPPDPLVGKTVEGFVVLKKIGVGSTSVVYQAMEKARDNRLVALKVLRPAEQRYLESSGAMRTNPFERERQFSKTLRSPGIIQIYGTGRMADGRYFVAMELVQGMTIQEELHHRGQFPPAEALHVIARAADAVASLHTLHIIHRDLKPSNIISRVGKDGSLRVKVIDFGLAKLAHERDAGSSAEGPGTPQYRAPEQALGAGTSAASDVYALGAILYEMVTGKPVLALRRPTAKACYAYLQSDHPIPAIPARQLAPDLPEAFDALFRVTLERDPARRCSDAAVLAQMAREAGELIDSDEDSGALGRVGRALAGLFRRERG